MILIYGATGYVGTLLLDFWKSQSTKLILAGRGPSVLELGEKRGIPAQVLGLEDSNAWDQALKGVKLVVNLAGPFAATSAPVIQACLRNSCHYIDIAGEVAEFETALSFDQAAKKAGIVVLPGAGFGVVPTDLVAARAARLLPGAQELEILYATEGGASRGTLKTVLKDIDKPGVVRVNGKFEPCLPGSSSRSFSVGGHQFNGLANPWRADLLTAGRSTGIATVRTFSTFPSVVVPMMKGKSLWLRNLLLGPLLGLLPVGPSPKELAKGATYIRAEVSQGNVRRAVTLTGPEAYRFTVLTLDAVAKRLTSVDSVPGFQTPSSLDSGLLDGVEGLVWTEE